MPATYEVISVEFVGFTTNDEYVYDLETKDGTYLAGDDIVLKNTDSCFVAFDIDRSKFLIEDNESNNNESNKGTFNETAYMTEQFRISQEAADYISTHFKEPMHLEFEKIVMPYFLFEKKRYAYQEWLKPTGPSKDLQHKGTFVVRRDYCPLTKEIGINLFEILMRTYKNDPRYNTNLNLVDQQVIAKDLAVKYAQESIKHLFNFKDSEAPVDANDVINHANDVINHANDVINYANDVINHANDVPISKLIISKSLRGTYNIKVDGADYEVSWINGLCKEHRLEKSKGSVCKKCKYCIDLSGECKSCADNFAELPQAHVRIAQRLWIIDPLNGPKPPDRVPFLFVKPLKGSRGPIKQCDITEHPDYIKGRVIDTLYYFEHQLKKPITQIFELMQAGLSEIVYDELVIAKVNENNHQNQITNFIKVSKGDQGSKGPKGDQGSKGSKELKIEGPKKIQSSLMNFMKPLNED